jgi:branched-chain amino acid transport system permease protein
MDWSQIFIDATRSAVGVPAAAFALAAIGLNIHYGYTGLLNFGQVGFMLVGAYGAAITVDQGGSLWLGVLVGVLAAVLLGLLLGLPTLRLRADYLAIVTIATAEILRLTARARSVEPLTNGVFGIQRFAGDFYDLNPINQGVYGFGRLSFSNRQLWVILVGWALVALMSLLVAGLSRSPWGRVLKAIREDEDAARALGKDVVSFKLQSLVLGGVIGSFAGMLLAFDQQSVNPDAYTANVTFFAFLIMILGGAGTKLGPVVGAITFWFTLSFVDSFLRDGIANDLFFSRWIDTTDLGAIRFALVGLALMLLMAFRPQGMLGDRDEVRLVDR